MTASEKRKCPEFLEHPKRFHLLGCCGTGMGALGVLLCEAGYEVSGSDTGFYPPMSDILARSGIRTMQGWEPSHLDGLDPADTIVVVGNFCRRTNEECIAAMERGFVTLSQPETLYHFFLKSHEKRIVISGTHGKTTTSSLIASILSAAGRDPSVFIGGEVLAYGCGAHLGNRDFFVVEGDEYDTAWFDKVPKFWHYAPNVLCINNIEFDHADIYNDLEEIIGVFEKLVRDMGPNGIIFYNADSENVCRVVRSASCPCISFSLQGHGDYVAENVEMKDGGLFLDVRNTSDNSVVAHISSPMTGLHNAYNLTAAAVITSRLGIEHTDIERGLAGYKGVKKRQELIGVAQGVTIYDDFAHHPTAVRETVRAIRARHPNARIWGIFEMKSNTSRRAVFQHEYPVAIAECNEVILSAPWKKDDLPPEQLINIPRIVEDLNAHNVHAQMIAEVDDIVNWLADHCEPGDVVLGMSGSAFGGLHRKLLNALNAKTVVSG
jgi:UDP-N-acetylmuramate: L-alanyl-gamma-D-glutamyl-meso-diaminopimelate ligase